MLSDLARRLDAIAIEDDLPTRQRLARELRLDIAVQLMPYSTAVQAPAAPERHAGSKPFVERRRRS